MLCPTCRTEFRKYGAKFCSRNCYEKSRNTRVQLSCKFCNKCFEVRPSDINKQKSGTIHFCSRECWKFACNKWNTKVDVTCKICGNIFQTKRSREKTSKFCSRACKTVSFDRFKGSDNLNPNFRNGSRVYRKRAFEAFKAECFICKTSSKKLYVHHIDESHENNNIDNLRILCASCHQLIHNGSIPSSKLFPIELGLKTEG